MSLKSSGSRIVLVYLLWISCAHTFANEPDSLVSRFRMSREADERAEIAYQILAKTIGSNPSFAGPFLLGAVNDSLAINEKNLANCYKGLSIVYFYKGMYDSAIFFGNRALVKFTSMNDEPEIEKVLKNRALSLAGKGNYSEAIGDYMRALNFHKIKHDTMRIVGTLNDIGNVYIKLKNYQEGMKFQREAMHYLRLYDNPALLGNVLNSVGFIYDVGKINEDSAIFYYKKSLYLKEKHGNIYSVINTKNNLCACYDLNQDLKEFITCFDELLELQKEISDLTGVVRSCLNLSTGYRKTRQYSKAIEYQQQAREYAEKSTDPSLLAEVYLRMSGLYKEQNKPGLALDAFEKHLQFKDSAFYTKRNELTIEMATQYELEKKNRAIAEATAKLTTAENERLLSLFRIRTRNFWIGGLSMLLLLGITTTMVFAQRLRTRKETEKAAAVLAERDRGIKAMIDAQEDERARIARDLHDGVGNNLLALHMRMNNLRDDDTPHTRDSILKSITGIMDEVRNVSHEMMPKVLQEFGCVPAIRDMLERTLGSSGIRYTFETHNTDKKYLQRIETAVYRITQELINNIVKHSGADAVTVQLIETDGTLVLFVEDNGSGVKAEKKTDGIGMTNIRTRLNAINGEIHISDGEVGGTVASIRIPLT